MFSGNFHFVREPQHNAASTTNNAAPKGSEKGWWAGGKDRMGWAGPNETTREEGGQLQLGEKQPSVNNNAPAAPSCLSKV